MRHDRHRREAEEFLRLMDDEVIDFEYFIRESVAMAKACDLCGVASESPS